MNYYPSSLLFWLRRIKAVYPDVYKEMPLEAKKRFYGVRLVHGEKRLDNEEKYGYTYFPNLDYLALKYKTAKEDKQYGFDLKRLTKGISNTK